jgi:hypothetical protein
MISFDEATHTYCINGDNTYTSVTTLLSSWFKEFDSLKTIQKMMANPSWSSSKYYGKTVEEIQQEWTTSGTLAAEQGTAMHAAIESYWKGEAVQLETVELKYFMDFVKNVPVETFQVEWRVFYEPYKLVGTIDYVAMNKDGSVDLYDWKRSADIHKAYQYCIAEGLTHIPCSKYWKYVLQLNLYRYIVEKMGYRVRTMFIVCFHPSQLGYQKHEAPKIELENVLNKCRGGNTCGL